MARILTIVAGFIAGGAVVAGTAVALDRAQASPRTPAVAPMTTSGMMGAAARSTATTKLVIQHVRRGCHVFTNGSRRATFMSLSLERGARLQLLNQDVDAHRLVQLAGPKLTLRGHMMMGQTQLITLKRPGLYRFRTRIVEMGPEMMDVETMGPDNVLRLTVTVR